MKTQVKHPIVMMASSEGPRLVSSMGGGLRDGTPTWLSSRTGRCQSGQTCLLSTLGGEDGASKAWPIMGVSEHSKSSSLKHQGFAYCPLMLVETPVLENTLQFHLWSPCQ